MQPRSINSLVRTLLRLALLAIAALFASGVSSAQITNQLGAGDNAISGEVVNAKTGAGVPRALVKLSGRAMLTDREGEFRFEGYSGNGTIVATKPGFYPGLDPSDLGQISLRAPQSGPIELRLYPEALLTGTLVSQETIPLSSIEVSAQRRTFDASGSKWVTVARTQTDSHGGFRLPVQAGSYRLTTQYLPQDPNSGQAVLPTSFPAGNTAGASDSILIGSGEEQHIALKAVSAVTHAVTLTATPSLRLAEMTASTGGSEEFYLGVMTSRGGEVEVYLPEGSYTLRARAGFGDAPQEAETSITVPNHDLSGVVLRFTPIATIPVEIITSDSSASSGSAPSLQQIGLTLQSVGEHASTISLKNLQSQGKGMAFLTPLGRYHLQAQSHGTWFLASATYGNSDLLQDDLVVGPGAGGESIQLTVSNQSGSVQGTLTLHGTPLAGGRIYLLRERASSVFTASSNTDGTFTIANLPPGDYRAIAFERPYGLNYRDPEALEPYLSYVQSVTVTNSEKTSVTLDAVPVSELIP